METFGKLLKAKSGHPEKATNSVKEIFEKSYEKLFITDFEINKAPELIENYFKIIKMYRDKKLRGNQLKYFYVIYFNGVFESLTFENVVDRLESVLNQYSNDNKLSHVKALGSTSFKNHFYSKLAS